jgi:hypothetical protein
MDKNFNLAGVWEGQINGVSKTKENEKSSLWSPADNSDFFTFNIKIDVEKHKNGQVVATISNKSNPDDKPSKIYGIESNLENKVYLSNYFGSFIWNVKDSNTFEHIFRFHSQNKQHAECIGLLKKIK